MYRSKVYNEASRHQALVSPNVHSQSPSVYYEHTEPLDVASQSYVSEPQSTPSGIASRTRG